MRNQERSNGQENFSFVSLADQCDPRHELIKLAKVLRWEKIEEKLECHYAEAGRPAKAIRLMVGLLLLKQLYNQSDESVVERWVENPYWQYFCGMTQFQWQLPCDPSDLVYFRRRIGEEGVSAIMEASVEIHQEKAKEKEVIVDSTVQEKNVTYPTDSKQYHKIIKASWKLASKNAITLRRRYKREVKKCLLVQRWRSNKAKAKIANKAQRRLRTIAGILVRELERKLPLEQKEHHSSLFELYKQILRQQPKDKQKIYSLHEPHIYCMSKGKAHKRYEFGTKASIAITKTHGIIVAAKAHEENIYDGHSLPEVLEQIETLSGRTPKRIIVDRGYRGPKQVRGVEILSPSSPATAASHSPSKRKRLRQCFRRRAAIEPVISHLKQDFRLMRCFLKGFVGDRINLLLAAAAWNFRKWMRQIPFSFFPSPFNILHLHFSFSTLPFSGTTN